MVLFVLLVPVPTFLAAEIGWLVLKPLRPHLRVIAYLVSTAGILFVGSWHTGIAYERYFETQYAARDMERSATLGRPTSSREQPSKSPPELWPCSASAGARGR